MKKALLLIILTPAQSSVKTDDTIRSKSSGGDSYRTNYDQINWGSKSNTVN